jgi:tetratricopeptide (TPR) repeat protein
MAGESQNRNRHWGRWILVASVLALPVLARDLGVNALAGLATRQWVRGNIVVIVFVVVAVTLIVPILRRIERDGPQASTAPSTPTPAAQPAHLGGTPPSGRRRRALHNLGSPSPAFTGRRELELLRQLDRLFGDGASTSRVALYGLGGVGKTELARAFAYRLVARYDVVWFIAAEQPAAIHAALQELASRLGLAPGSDRVDLAARLVEELERRGRWLLVLDGVARPADLPFLLSISGSGQLLITSRNPAWGPDALPVLVPCWSPSDAREFLLTQTDSVDTSAADELAEALGRLPLAMAQAVAYVNLHPGVTLRGYLHRYRERHQELLEDESCQPSGYPATVATTWQLAFEDLAEHQRPALQLLQLVSFLAPDAKIPLSLLLAADVDRLPRALRPALRDWRGLDAATAPLQHHGLISSDSDGFRVHRLVQTVTRDHLPPLRSRKLATVAADLITSAFPQEPSNPSYWEGISELLPHALAVVAHTESDGPDPELLRVLGVYLGSMNRSDEELRDAHRHLTRALKLAEGGCGGQHPSVAQILSNLGGVLFELGDHTAAEENLWQAAAILAQAQGTVEPLQIAGAVNNLAIILGHRGDLDGAHAAARQAVDIVEGAYCHDGIEIAAPLETLGTILSRKGLQTEARATVERALRILEATYQDGHREIARTRVSLGQVLSRQGDRTGAAQQFWRARPSFERTYGPRHPQTARINAELASVLRPPGPWAGLRRGGQGSGWRFPVRHPGQRDDTRVE